MLSKINLKLAYLNNGFCNIENHNLAAAEDNLKLAQIIPSDNSEELIFYPKDFVQQQNLYVQFGFARLLALKDNIEMSNAMLAQILEKGRKINIEPIRTDLYKQLSENNLKIGKLSESKNFENLYETEINKNKKNQEKLLNVLIIADQKNTQTINNGIIKKIGFLATIISILGVLIILFLFKKILKIKQKYKNLKKEIHNHSNNY